MKECIEKGFFKEVVLRVHTLNLPQKQEIVVLPPDGGWGWVVVAASFMCNVLVDGIIFTAGMLFSPIMEEFDISYSQVSWVSSLIGGFYLLAGEPWRVKTLGGLGLCLLIKYILLFLF